MARAELASQNTSRAGLNATYTPATADGHAIDNASAKAILHVKNGSGVSTVVTIPTPNTVDGLAVTDLTVSIPAGEDRFIGPFPKGVYNQDDSAGDTGIEEAVFINASPTTSVTYAAIKPGAV